MATITYTAQEALKTGHTAGVEYTITVSLRRLDETPKNESKQQTTLGNVVFTDLYYIQAEYSIETVSVDETGTNSAEDMREFIYSVMDGQQFSFTEGSTTLTMVLTGQPRITRLEDNSFRFAFTAITQ